MFLSKKVKPINNGEDSTCVICLKEFDDPSVEENQKVVTLNCN